MRQNRSPRKCAPLGEGRTALRPERRARSNSESWTRMNKKPVIIDFHAHSTTQAVFDATYGRSILGQLRAQADGSVRAYPQQQIDKMTNLSLRFEEMDRMGVDIQVVSPNILHQCTYDSIPEEG